MPRDAGLRGRLLPEGWRALLASALLVAVAYPPFRLVLPSVVALAPLGVWIAGRRSGGEAFRGGLWFGVVLWLLLLRWLPVTLARFFPEALPGWLIAVAALATVAALAVWAAWRLHHRVGVPLWLALPVGWTAGEWLRAHLPGSLAFPWLDLGTSLATTPELVGIAELVGSRGTGFVLALLSGLLASAWLAAGASAAGSRLSPPALRRAVPPLAAALLVAAAAAGWGVHRAGTLETRSRPTVAVVQTAVPQEVKADRWRAAERGMAALERLLPVAAGDGDREPDLIVVPEAVLPVPLEGRDARRLRERLEAAVRRAGVPMLVGALGLEGEVTYNSVFLVRPGTGIADRRYDKRHLVPVVERVPLPAWAGGGAGGRWGSHGAGASAEPFRVAGHGFGVLVCLESSFSRAARALRLEGADVLVNPTNDAWLNGPGAWTRVSALRQHPAHLVMRAVETRTGAVRAANTGLSMFVDPTGRTHPVAAPFEEGVAARTVPTTQSLTLFVRFGDVAGAASAALAVALLLASLAAPGVAAEWVSRRGHTGRLRG